jgi:hypothetical protein
MNCSQKKIVHSSKEITMEQMKKPAAKKVSNGSNTKPYNVRPIKPAEIIKDKPKAKTTTKAPAKAPVKKKVVQMPSKISPSKMTPAQKAKYLQNPERYDK